MMRHALENLVMDDGATEGICYWHYPTCLLRYAPPERLAEWRQRCALTQVFKSPKDPIEYAEIFVQPAASGGHRLSCNDQLLVAASEKRRLRVTGYGPNARHRS